MARTERELTDAQWAKLAPLLPPQRPRMGRPPKDHRLIVEAIVWLDRTGVPWRDLPGQFGPWATLASRFYRWRRQGMWDRVLQALQADADARGELDWLLHFVDGSVVRAHQHAAGARRRPPAADLAAKARGAPADPDQQDDREREALGRSRGGYSTKLHLRVEGGGKPMVILATAGQRNEAPMLRALMEAGAVRRPRGRPRIRPAAVAGDKGNSFPSLRRYLRRRGIRAVIPSKSNQPPPVRLRPGRLPRAQPGGAHDQPAQAVAPGRDPLREARGQLPGDGHDHCDRAAVAGMTLQPCPRLPSTARLVRRAVDGP